MKYIDDLSYSNLVNLIQGEEKKGADILTNIAHEMDEVNNVIGQLEIELVETKKRKKSLVEGAQNVLQHLNKKLPLAVQISGYIIVVTKDSISIERNVL